MKLTTHILMAAALLIPFSLAMGQEGGQRIEADQVALMRPNADGTMDQILVPVEHALAVQTAIEAGSEAIPAGHIVIGRPGPDGELEYEVIAPAGEGVYVIQVNDAGEVTRSYMAPDEIPMPDNPDTKAIRELCESIGPENVEIILDRGVPVSITAYPPDGPRQWPSDEEVLVLLSPGIPDSVPNAEAAADTFRPVGPCISEIGPEVMLADIDGAIVTPLVIKEANGEDDYVLLTLAPPIADDPYTLYGWVQYQGDAPESIDLICTYPLGGPEPLTADHLAAEPIATMSAGKWHRFALTFHYNPEKGAPESLMLLTTIQGDGESMFAVAVVGMVAGDRAPVSDPPTQSPFRPDQWDDSGPLMSGEAWAAQSVCVSDGDGPLPAGVMADEEIVQTISWEELFGGPAVAPLAAPDGTLTDGMLVDGERVDAGPGPEISVIDMGSLGQCLLVDNPAESGEMSLSLLAIDQPAITSERYVIVGLVGYDIPGEPGMLEMWSHFADGNSYFTKTVTAGPMAPLGGRSDWRVFRLPFTMEPGVGPPAVLDFNLLLPGPGRVILGPTYLVQARAEIPQAEDQPEGSSPWKGVLLTNPWPPSREAWIGLGCLAALWLFTSIANWLIKRGKARRFVLVWLWGLVVMCGVFIVNFIVMMITDKTYLISGIAIGVVLLFGVHFVNTLRRVSARYADFELRKMSAKDVG